MFLNMLYISYYLHWAVFCQLALYDAKLAIFSETLRLRRKDNFIVEKDFVINTNDKMLRAGTLMFAARPRSYLVRY